MKIKNILFILMVTLLAWSCEEESNLQPEGNWELSEPTLVQLNDGNKLVLDESAPLSKIEFKWNPAVSSAGYGVYYTVVIDSLNAADTNHPILSLQAEDAGKSTSAFISTLALNEALYMAGFEPGEDIELQWSVVASCLSKTSSKQASVTMVRYDDDNLYLSGRATEIGDDVNKAILMKRLLNAAGDKLNLYEAYTQLKANEGFMVYNGRSSNAVAYGLDTEGNLVRNGQPITVDNEGIYRINIDFEAMSISFFKIDRLALIGDALEGGWDADEALTYKGMGVWQADLSFIRPGGYIIRANNDWQGIMKQVNGTPDEVVLEDFANAQGYSIDNFQQSEAGYYSVTLSLTGKKYTLNLEKAPEQQMYVIVNGTDAYNMTLVGDGRFATTSYLALQTTDNILINTKSDGSGTSYSIDGAMEQGDSDKVGNTLSIVEGSNSFSPAVDQAYRFEVDVKNSEFKWHYYNLKLFHWDDDAEGGWDAKTETLMTYSHPYVFTATADLQADFESKFFSPWDIQFGAGANDDKTALVGTATNDSGASNLQNILSSATYTIKLTVAPDFSTANYEFVAQ
ncbi:SusE outer membrane protein [Saccharicrinis carchari]|uniref:SusE outer membrane protein n=1 Tax=Saccharicrinis carchari TaxID=1168039 RepID=A0A521D4Q2_SACCC|nr:SusE domain-containing protein [Saccharicrinis carchari]SMO66592.1 SusE outer membrane protein [Saccharicrinis carchari]